MAPLREYCLRRLVACRATPEDNLANDIANAELDGAPLPVAEALSMLCPIYIAGHQSTTAGLQGALLRIASAAAVKERLRLDHRLIPAATEECHRLETPLHALPRYCTRDVELGDRRVRAGDQVYPVFGAANLDPAMFAESDELSIKRRPVHFAFGRSTHMCAGAPLARMKIRVLLEELLARTSTFAITGHPLRKAWPHNGCETLALELRSAR